MKVEEERMRDRETSKGDHRGFTKEELASQAEAETQKGAQKESKRPELGPRPTGPSQNWALLYPCKPGTGIIMDSMAAYEIMQAFTEGCGSDLFCTFPAVLGDLHGRDANFELLTSTTLRPLQLFLDGRKPIIAPPNDKSGLELQIQ